MSSWVRGRKGSAAGALFAFVVGAVLGRAAVVEDMDLVTQQEALMQVRADEQSTDLADLQATIDGLQEQVEDAEAEAEELDADVQAALADLEAVETARSEAEGAQLEVEDAAATLGTEVERLADDIAARDTEIEEQAVTIADLQTADQALAFGPVAPPADPPPPPPPPVAAAPSQPFENCTAARAAGATPVRRGEPGYGPHLDRDNDGIGCE
ncbi:MAG TPA: excalibur calcium-binding domain-containing protein [Euzebya sp.]|nr:excalibur calcium-binding domain-containing protein [Euzebya sp.]